MLCCACAVRTPSGSCCLRQVIFCALLSAASYILCTAALRYPGARAGTSRVCGGGGRAGGSTELGRKKAWAGRGPPAILSNRRGDSAEGRLRLKIW